VVFWVAMTRLEVADVSDQPARGARSDRRQPPDGHRTQKTTIDLLTDRVNALTEENVALKDSLSTGYYVIAPARS